MWNENCRSQDASAGKLAAKVERETTVCRIFGLQLSAVSSHELRLTAESSLQ